MKHLLRYRLVWRGLRAITRPWLKRKFNYEADLFTGKGPFLLLCNHNTDWDPLLLGCAVSEYMSFVASEHIFRWGFKSKLIVFLLDPIARMKGRTASDTAKSILKRLRSGVSVAMFPEGNRSFNGLTGEIYPAVGKLAKRCGAALVTYRLEGGYFTSPRWSTGSLRRGKMKGRLIRVYEPEELNTMDADAINEAIRRDLYENAYAVQRREMTAFCGEALAEGLERVLCICPRCGKTDSMRGEGDALSCSCGFCARIDEYGFLSGEGVPFDNITEWDAALTEQLIALADAADGLIFSDGDMTLKEIFSKTHEETVLGCGELALYRDRIECCGMRFPLAELEGFSIHGAQTVDMSYGGRSFEIGSDAVRCTRKYMTVIEQLIKQRTEKPLG